MSLQPVGSGHGKDLVKKRLNYVLFVAAVVIPTVSACGASGGSSACSSANERQMQTSMSNVEARARVTPVSAFAPTCNDSPDAPGLSAQRIYRSNRGAERAIETALADSGWATSRTSDGYQAQLKSGRFTTHVELTVHAGDENDLNDPNGSFVTALYSFD